MKNQGLKYESLHEYLKGKKQLLESHDENLNFVLFKALVLPTFTYGTEIWRGNLKNSLEGFQVGHEDAYDVSCQSGRLSYFAN